MLQAIQNNFNRFLNKGHERSVKIKKNVFQSLLIKGGSVAISFTLIPLTINYVNPAQYGIWLTLSSIITWAALFDLGLGNGLKNKLTELITLNDTTSAKGYVSSAYALLFAISLLLFIIFYFLNPVINWNSILNTPVNREYNLNNVVLIVFGIFCFQFVVQLINTVLTACQFSAKASLLNFVAQLLTLLAILLLIKIRAKGSLNYLVIVLAGTPLIALIAGSFWHYKNSLKALSPAFSFVNFSGSKKLLGLGGAFFIIQIGALVLYETDNIVITQLFGPGQVTAFNVVYKLFSVILIFFMIVITPFWSAFTEAYVKNDYEWIKNTIRKINRLWLVLSIGAIILLILSPWIFRFWVGKSVAVPFSLSLSMCVYTIILVWQIIHVQLLNGIGKIKLQFYLIVAASIANIPLAIMLGRSIGLAGVTLSNAIVVAVMGIFFSIQTGKIINRTATGIFNA